MKSELPLKANIKICEKCGKRKLKKRKHRCVVNQVVNEPKLITENIEEEIFGNNEGNFELESYHGSPKFDEILTEQVENKNSSIEIEKRPEVSLFERIMSVNGLTFDDLDDVDLAAFHALRMEGSQLIRNDVCEIDENEEFEKWKKYFIEVMNSEIDNGKKKSIISLHWKGFFKLNCVQELEEAMYLADLPPSSFNITILGRIYYPFRNCAQVKGSYFRALRKLKFQILRLLKLR